MRKQQLVFRPDGPTTHAGFARRIEDEVLPALLAEGPARLKAVFTERPPPRLALLPFSRAPVAVVSWWSDEAAPTRRHPGFTVQAYEVEEAVPRAYERTWPDGERSPGVNLLTLFSRRPGLDDATFFARWHDGHTPLSLEIHPLWAYVRNVVREPLDGAPRLDGIVEEQFRSAADLLRPTRMYGGGLLPTLRNMVRVGVDIHGFMDLRSMEVFLATELHLRS